MTAIQAYEAVLIEMNKENAPNITLEDFNYFINKAINQYVNKRYNIYDINQQTTDDLRVLKATAFINITNSNRVNSYDGLSTVTNGNATYEITLPSDYLHMLNCICVYTVEQLYKCYNKNTKFRAAAKRLTADSYSQVLDNFWNKPTYKRPYYYIHNINKLSMVPTNSEEAYPSSMSWDSTKKICTTKQGGYLTVTTYERAYDDPNGHGEIVSQITTKNSSSPQTGFPFKGTDVNTTASGNNDGSTGAANSGNNIGDDKSLPKTITLAGGSLISNVEKSAGTRFGNVSEVRCEIRYGTDDSVFKLTGVYIDYIKVPQFIRITQEQLDKTNDTSQILEFPDYVCQEIVNELVRIIMENISDLRILTHPVVNLSIANPAQQLTEPVAQQLS